MRNFTFFNGTTGMRLMLAVLMTLPFVLNAQDKTNSAEVQNYPAHMEADPSSHPERGGASSRALWDVQFNYSTTAATNGDAGMAAAIFHKGTNEFWVSRWASDTLYRFDVSGNLLSEFVIAGLSGTRSLTTDGTFLYSGNASGTIYQINPVTRTLTGNNISIQANVTARHCSYDSTADNNNGGFWVGNFNTDIVLVSRTGATLTTIPQATHGLGGMYGSAVDHYSNGGPYLWVFHQGGSNQSEITQLSLPGGTQTILTHDVMSDVGSSGTSGLAGGLFISDGIVSGQWTIGGLLQGTPDNILFGYELDNPAGLPPYDAQINSIRPTEGYTQIPSNQIFPETFEAEVANVGTDPLDTLKLTIEVEYGGNVVWTDVSSTTSLASGGTANLVSSAYTPSSGNGTYTVNAMVSPGAGQTDTIPGNNMLTLNFEVTDSIFARDDGNPTGTGYVVSATDWGYAGANYTLSVDDTLSSIFISLQTPVDGDTTYPVVYSTSGGFPFQLLYQGNPVIIQAGVEDYYLTIPGGLPLTAGTYTFGVYEGVNTGISLKQSANVFTPGTNFFFTFGSGWVGSNIATARWIHPHFSDDFVIGVKEELDENGIAVYPNPAADVLFVQFDTKINEDVHITVVNSLGQVVNSRIANPQSEYKVSLDLSSLPSGIYFVNAVAGDKKITKKIIH